MHPIAWSPPAHSTQQPTRGSISTLNRCAGGMPTGFCRVAGAAVRRNQYGQMKKTLTQGSIKRWSMEYGSGDSIQCANTQYTIYHMPYAIWFNQPMVVETPQAACSMQADWRAHWGLELGQR